MKKIIGLLSAITLTTTTSATVLACGPFQSNDFDENTGLTNSEKAQMRNNFISEANQLISNHLTGNIGKLYVSKAEAVVKDFISYDNLFEITTNKTGVPNVINLNGADFLAFKNDIDNLLNINGELKQKLDSVLNENTQYQFLLVNIDQILSGFNLNNRITVSAQEFFPEGEDESQFFFTLKFDISFEFKYTWNNSIEFEESTSQNLKYFLMPDGLIKESVLHIVNNLANQVYSNDVNNLFRLNEEELEILKTSGSFYTKQANAVENFFTNNAKNDLKAIVINAVTDVVSNPATASQIIFDYNEVIAESTNTLYKGENNQTIITDGFWDLALFNKAENVTEAQIETAFESDFAMSYGKQNFVNNEELTILNKFNIKINSSDEEVFTEYGSIILQSPHLQLFGLEMELNPISLMWVYNPIATFAQSATKLFANWRNNWGVTTASDRWALFKLSQATPAGDSFWTGDPYKPFAWINEANETTYFPDSIYYQTGFKKMSISNSISNKNPYADFWIKGFAVNYFGYCRCEWSETNSDFDSSWLLIVTIGDIKFSINFAKNKDYFNNVWVGSGFGNTILKFIIERG